MQRFAFLVLLFIGATTGLLAQASAVDPIDIDQLQKEAEEIFERNDSTIWPVVRKLVLEAENTGTDDQRLNAWRLQGDVYRLRSDYATAIQFFLKALEIAERKNDFSNQGLLNRLTGISYRMMDDFPRALFFYNRSLENYSQTADSSAVMNAYNNLASIHFLLNDLPSAERFNVKLMSMARRNNDVYWKISAIRLSGLIAGQRGDYSAAVRYHEEALELVRKTEHTDRLLLGISGLQKAYGFVGKYQQGIQLGREAISLSLRDSNFVTLETAHQHQAELFEKIGNADSAYFHLKKRLYFRDRMISADRARISTDLQARYELGKKEAAIHTLQNEQELNARLMKNQRQLRDILIVAIIFILGFLGLVISRFRLKQKGERALRESNEKLEKALQESKKAREEAEEASRLKTELLGIAAHDLKNPLSSISGLAELLELEAPEKDELLKIAAQIRKSSARMYRLVVDLLNTAAEDAGRLELRKTEVAIKEVLETSVAAFHEEARRKRQALLVSIKSDQKLLADAERLLEIFDNLISNALKYSPIGGTIRIHCETPATLPGWVRVTVTDSGPGLTPEDLTILFQRFKRLSALPTGGETSTGLGLSIVKKLVNMHGGTVRAESPGKGKGSSFIVELPL